MSSNDTIPYIIRMGSGLGYNTPNQIFFASVFGGPFAGIWLMSKNARNFGDTKGASRMKLAGLGAMLAVIALFHYVPRETPFLLVPVILSLALRQYMVMKQGKEIQKYAQQGYYRNPLPNVVFTSLISLLALLLLGYVVLGVEGYLFFKTVF